MQNNPMKKRRNYSLQKLKQHQQQLLKQTEVTKLEKRYKR